MSNTNYDVELPITYDNAYRHYVPTYAIKVPYAWIFEHSSSYIEDEYMFHAYVSFDDGSESEVGYHSDAPVSNPWSIDAESGYYTNWNGSWTGDKNIPDIGVFNKIYIRNPHRDKVTFTSSNCAVKALYNNKADFEIQWNSTGHVANSNVSFKCSTVQKNTPGQYEWASCVVYYKTSSASTYSSTSGTITGSWSDYTISTNVTFTTGVVYNVYIVATADDGTQAQTPVASFASTDGTPTTNCVSPVGTYTNGTVNFVWSHSTEYGTTQYAYDLQYSANNGGSWTTVANHVVSSTNNRTVTISSAGVYLWRVRTYNTLNVSGSWASASFINNIPATPPANLNVTTKGRPTASWVSTTQSAYQLQVLLNNEIIYDSGAVYSSQNSHFINEYFDDTRAYTVRVRIYNSLGEESEWTSRGYQQPSVNDVNFEVIQRTDGGVTITIIPDDVHTKYYLKRNNVLIGEILNNTYIDRYAIGATNYSVVGVTSEDQSDIQSKSIKVEYPSASIITLSGGQYRVNKRVDKAFEIQTTNEADMNKVSFLGDSTPTHYLNKMRLKSFVVSFFDDNDIVDDILGTVVFYADNFGNGGYCVVTAYDRTNSFIKNGAGVYGNEVSLTLEVTNYDDSIEYPV